MIVTIIVFVFILGLLIFVHELGHFIAAKRAGIRVDEFAFGFPPRLWAIKSGETEYSINLLPFGGYVKMLGEDEDVSVAEKQNPRSFAHGSVWTRSKVIIAGVTMNMILGWLLISMGYVIGMPPVITDPAKIPYAKTTKTVTIAGIAAGSVAASIGLAINDNIIEFNGTPVASKEELAAATKAAKGQSISLKVKRGKQELTKSGQLAAGDAPLGVSLADDVRVRLPLWWAPIYGLLETFKAIGLIFVGVVRFFKELFVIRHIPPEAAGPVGIFYFTRSVLELGFGALLNFVAILSINLGVINVLPVPALDGGRLLFVLLEKLNRGRKVVSQQIENLAHTVGFAALIVLLLAITYNDILRLGH